MTHLTDEDEVRSLESANADKHVRSGARTRARSTAAQRLGWLRSNITTGIDRTEQAGSTGISCAIGSS